MKTIGLYSVIACFVFLSLVSCSGNDDNQLKGGWVITSIEKDTTSGVTYSERELASIVYLNMLLSENANIIFMADNTYLLADKKGDYSIEGDTLVLKAKEGELKLNYIFEPDNKLLLKVAQSDYRILLKRQ